MSFSNFADIPYPTPADRKDLESLVKTNWESKVSAPIANVAGATVDSYDNVKDYVFDTWTESQIKAFLDKNGIPAPQPRKRDSLIATARENYESVAKKLGQSTYYPGNWLYEAWSESDLKEFLDTHGLPSPQPTTRDKLIASVRRNAHLASLKAKEGSTAASKSAASVSQAAASAAADASKSAAAAQESLTDSLFQSWSDSDFKAFFDKNNIKVPQGSKRNELVALARKHRAYLLGDTVSASAASAFGAATTKAGNQYAQATDDAQLKAQDASDSVISTWSDSALKEWLDARGVPVPQSGKRDELLAKVRLNRHKAATGWGAWTFDTWTAENLQNYLSSQGDAAAKKASGSRDDLVKEAKKQYAAASKSGGSAYASVTSYLAASTDSAKDSAFDTWSDSELKNYLDYYGVPTYQGSTTNELRAAAKRNWNFFRYGTSTPTGTVFAKVQAGVDWVWSQIKLGAYSGRDEGEKIANDAKAKVKAEL